MTIADAAKLPKEVREKAHEYVQKRAPQFRVFDITKTDVENAWLEGFAFCLQGKVDVKIADLQKELEKERNLNAEIKARFVKCNTCTDEMKSKCLMFTENLCQGERCEELVDLMALINKDEPNDKQNK